MSQTASGLLAPGPRSAACGLGKLKAFSSRGAEGIPKRAPVFSARSRSTRQPNVRV